MLYEFAERVFELKKNGHKIISLNLGETNLPIPQCAIDALIKCGKNKNVGYSSAAGIKELRAKIAEREKCDINNVVIGPGSKHLIHALVSVLGEKGKKIIIPNPNWPTYESNAKLFGLKPEIVETSLEAGWLFGSLNFQDACLAVLCNPLNPASIIYPKSLMKKTIEEAKENGTKVIIDEAYRELAFKKIEKYNHAIRVRSFSKEFNMEGFRLGYTIAPQDIAKKVIGFNQISITCIPEFVQKAGIACLENEKEILEKNRSIWEKRMGFASKKLKQKGFKFAEPESGIYVFATHENIGNGLKFANNLLKEGVAVAPGQAFGNCKRFVRISINQPEEVLEKAFNAMGNMLNKK